LFTIKKTLYSDTAFLEWLAESQKNNVSTNIILTLSLFTSWKWQRLILSRYFGFSFFSAKVTTTENLFIFNLINLVSMILSEIPASICFGVVAY